VICEKDDELARLSFVILGAQKSASTFLQNCVREHPNVWMPVGETPCFESPDYESNAYGSFLKSLQDITASKIGIKRPDYFAKPEVAQRIEKELPEAKLIVVLRNPVERALSAWYHNINEGFLPAMSAEDGLRLLLGAPDHVMPEYPRSRQVLEYGFYAKHLGHYRDAFEQGRLLILLHEDVIKQPQMSLKKAFEHLDVSPNFLPTKRLKERPQAVIYNLKRLQWLRFRSPLLNRFSQDGLRIIGKHKNPVRLLMAAVVVATDRLAFSPLFGNEKPELSSELRSMLYQYYEKDIECLVADYGLPVEHWRLTDD